MALDVLNWGSEHHREEVNFVLESRLLCYSNNNATNGGGGGNGGGEATSGWTVKMTPVNALLTTLGNNGSSFQGDGSVATHAQLQFPKETGVRQAAVIMIKEKGGRYTMVRVSLVQVVSVTLLQLSFLSVQVYSLMLHKLRPSLRNVCLTIKKTKSCNVTETTCRTQQFRFYCVH